MIKYKISLIDVLPVEAKEKMEKGLDEYEASCGVDVNYKPFALLLYNEKNDVIGVLDAFSSYSCIHIRDMWVDKVYRGQGYGKLLLAELEKHFKGKGLNNINLITCDFQAPGFYKQCGFEVEFVRKNIKNPKLNMTFFIKQLNE